MVKPVIFIGNQDFRDLRKAHSFYVDKMDFIREWWENNHPVILITRLGRFGKNLSDRLYSYYD